MAEFFSIYVPALAAFLTGVVIVYAGVLVSKGEKRRAISTFLASMMLIGGLTNVYWALTIAAKPAFPFFIAIIIAGAGLVWLHAELTGD